MAVGYLTVEGREEAGGGLDDGGEGELVGEVWGVGCDEEVEIVEGLLEEVVLGEGSEEGVPDDEVGAGEGGEGE